MHTMTTPPAHGTRPAAPGSPWQRPVACKGAWSLGMLQGFTLMMAGRGVCVNETMMLCDPDYARARLRHACTLPDPRLQQLAVDMLSTLGAAARPGSGTDIPLAH
jgi:hypothetical protein